MTSDRVSYDPYAPHPPAAPHQLEPEVTEIDLQRTTRPSLDLEQVPTDDLGDLLKSELMDRARRLGLDTSGTKADLIDRIRGAR